jgi:ACR3 family arsenite transporter
MVTDAAPLETAPADAHVIGRLSALNRLLPVWIFLAMAFGVALGAVAPWVADALDSARVGTISFPIAIGLLWMMYPVLARVKYEELARVGRAWRLFSMSLALNWVVGPLVMFALAWLLLPDQPEYRMGLILVGLARCIAMVLVWNELAGGDREDAAALVALNSVFQVLAYSFYAWLFLAMLPRLIGLGTQDVTIGFWEVARSVLIFLGLPLALGVATRWGGIRARGRAWYEDELMPRLAPTSLVALLFTIVVMFSLKGDVIVHQPADVVRIALPLLAYFAVMFFAAFWLGWRSRFSYEETAAMSFTAAGNNFELAIAVAVGTFGIASDQALASVVGPLIEVPALVGLVYVALSLRGRLAFAGGRRAAS